MRSLIRSFSNRLSRWRVMRMSSVDVAASARMNWRGVGNPPSRLQVGEGSIFEGGIASDRDGSCVVIGRNTFIGRSTIIAAERVEIGDDVLISWGCTIVDHDSHSLDWSHRQADVRSHYAGHKDWSHVPIRPVRICDKVWIGFNVIILKGVVVGEGAVIAAGSVVTRDVPPFTLVGGNPARTIRSLQKAPA